MKRLIEDALKATGVRGKLEEGKKRHEFQTDHGFRKFFKSMCERRMKSLHVEMLLGHSVGLGDNYYGPQETEMLEEYLEAVPELTIIEKRAQAETEDLDSLKNEVKHLRQELANQVKEKSKYERLAKQFEELRAEVNALSS